MAIGNKTARIEALHVAAEARRKVEKVSALVKAVLKEYRYWRCERFRLAIEWHDEVRRDGRRI
jgi:hypothetical protein